MTDTAITDLLCGEIKATVPRSYESQKTTSSTLQNIFAIQFKTGLQVVKYFLETEES